MSKESYFIGCAEVAELVGCGKSRAYKYIQQMNQELEARGNLTFPGRVPRRYAMERFGLLEEVREDADLEDAKPFIEEWQQVVQRRMTASEISFAKQSKEIRAQEFAELKENGNIIRTGANAGKLLVDELMHDLMEVEKRVG